jgi:hypothetical protein
MPRKKGFIGRAISKINPKKPVLKAADGAGHGREAEAEPADRGPQGQHPQAEQPEEVMPKVTMRKKGGNATRSERGSGKGTSHGTTQSKTGRETDVEFPTQKRETREVLYKLRK